MQRTGSMLCMSHKLRRSSAASMNVGTHGHAVRSFEPLGAGRDLHLADCKQSSQCLLGERAGSGASGFELPVSSEARNATVIMAACVPARSPPRVRCSGAGEVREEGPPLLTPAPTWQIRVPQCQMRLSERSTGAS